MTMPPLPTTAEETFAAYASANLVNNARTQVQSVLTVSNPATGQNLGTAAASNADETAEAITAAKSAQSAWAALPARDRGKCVSAAARALAEHAELIAQVLARETGKAIRTECRGEVTVAADIIDFYGNLGSEIKGQTIPYNPRMLTMTTREPLGVVAAIVPWNVPLVLFALKVGPALVEDQGHRALYVFNHFEYDSNTLKQEYDRDVAEGTPINVPVNYYPDDDPSKPPQNRWRSHAHLLYGNWISEIYETTPFDLSRIGLDRTDLRG